MIAQERRSREGREGGCSRGEGTQAGWVCACTKRVEAAAATRVGARRERVSPWPSCPCAPHPQLHTTPATIASECAPPACDHS